MNDVIVINRDDASRACAKAVREMLDHLDVPEEHKEFHAIKIMELTVFSAMIVSKLFDEEDHNNEAVHTGR